MASPVLKGDSGHRVLHIQRTAHMMENMRMAASRPLQENRDREPSRQKGGDARGDVRHRHGGRAAEMGTIVTVPVLLSS